MRRFVLAIALVGAAAPLLAQPGMDADKKVAGGGTLAPGWQMRLDPRAGSGTEPKFVAMGNGFHATSGARAICWRPEDVAKGTYKVEATFTLTKEPMHDEAYGLFFGGRNLKDSTQNYMYFTLGGKGKYLIKHRAGDADSMIHTIVPWTESDAISQPTADGKRTDKLTVVVGAEKVQFLVNDKEVFSADRAKMPGGGNFDGIYGIRVSHNLDVHIDGPKLVK